MACYEFQCPICGKTAEIDRPMAERDVPVDCKRCGHRMNRVYTYSKHIWVEDLGLPAGMTNADAMSITEKAKKEFGVMKKT